MKFEKDFQRKANKNLHVKLRYHSLSFIESRISSSSSCKDGNGSLVYCLELNLENLVRNVGSSVTSNASLLSLEKKYNTSRLQLEQCNCKNA